MTSIKFLSQRFEESSVPLIDLLGIDQVIDVTGRFIDMRKTLTGPQLYASFSSGWSLAPAVIPIEFFI